MLAALTNAAEHLTDARSNITTATSTTDAYLVAIGADTTRRADTTLAQPPTAERRRPPAVDRYANRLASRRPGGPVEGYLVASNGSAVKVTSGTTPDTAADLLPTYRPVAVDHAEGRAARQMRRYGVRHADLVVNAEPCNYPTVGCRDALPEMLPAGSTVTIWVGEDDGSIRYFGTCRGDGRAIRS